MSMRCDGGAETVRFDSGKKIVDRIQFTVYDLENMSVLPNGWMVQEGLID